MRARDSLALRLADLPRRMAEEDRQNQDQVIAEFGGDAAAMADEILCLRRGLKVIADAVGLAQKSAPVALIRPGPYWRPRATGVPSRESNGEQVDGHGH
jgi:hypothetical protein